MSLRSEDVGTRVWWVVHRWRWLAVAVVALFVVLGFVKGSGTAVPHYEASTLLVATDLTIRADQLPRFAETVFRGGRVARETKSQTNTDVDAEDLIPEHIRVEPVEDNVLMRVVGTARDAEQAAGLSHAAAVALATEMNRAGPGVGSFTIQEEAHVPDRPIPSLGTWTPLVVSTSASIMFVLAGAGLLLVTRRPIIGPQSAMEATDLPLLGTPVLKRQRDPLKVAGLGVLVHRLFPTGRERVLIVGLRGQQRKRLQLVELLVRTLARRGNVAYVPADPEQDPLTDQSPQRIFRLEPSAMSSLGKDTPLIIDGGSVEDADVQQLVDLLPDVTTTALVVLEGAPEWQAVAAASQLADRTKAGIVFVTPSLRRTALPSRSEAGEVAGNGTDIQSWGAIDIQPGEEPHVEERYVSAEH